MATLPAVFVSHGSPMLTFEPDRPTHQFLKVLGKRFPRPKAVLVISAHWETVSPMVGASAHPPTIHDYGGGFPYPELYTVQYPAPGAPDIARRVKELLDGAGFPTGLDPRRGFDHGVWAPLRLTYPDADIPVLQLSLQTHLGPAYHIAIGRALAPLRDEGVLIYASGTMVHNLYDFDRSDRTPTAQWAVDFAEWFAAKLAVRDDAAVADYRRLAPHAARSHPTDEHLMPIYVAIGAGEPGKPPERLHSDIVYSTQAMDAYLFN